MTGTKVDAITSSDSGIIVLGTTNFELRGSLSSGQNWLIPNFKGPVNGCLSVGEEQIIELESDLTLEEASRKIFEFIEIHPGAKTSDLIIELSLDPKIVVEALEKLRTDNRIEGKNVEAKQ